MTPYYYDRAISPWYDIDKWQISNNKSFWDSTTDSSTWMSNATNMATGPTTIKVTTGTQQTIMFDVKSVTVDVNHVLQAIDKAEVQLRRAFKPPKNSPRRKVVPESALGPIRRDPPPRSFNKYINASDLLEEFIRYVGTEGVRQSEVLGLPIELFVKWLVIRACEADDEEPNVTLELPTRKTQPRCLGCQRFMRRDVPVPIHDGDCATRYFARVA